MSKEKGEKNKGGKIEDPRTNVDCYVVVKEHDSNSDSLVDCCGLVGCVSDNTRSNGWLLGGRDWRGGRPEELSQRRNF